MDQQIITGFFLVSFCEISALVAFLKRGGPENPEKFNLKRCGCFFVQNFGTRDD